MRRRIGCGLWIVFLFIALFTGEWLLLWLVVQNIPREYLVPAVFGVVLATIVGGWVAVYLRVQRRAR